MRDSDRLTVEGLGGGRVGGSLLTVSGGTGARIRDVGSSGSTGAAVRLRASAGTEIDTLTSSGDAAALLVLLRRRRPGRPGGVSARGDGVVLGGRGIELTDIDVDAPAKGVLRVPALLSSSAADPFGQGRGRGR